MLTSLALIFIAGLAMAALCRCLRLPGIIGMLATGIILGPFCLDLFDPSILMISAELRRMALIIILIKAGLSLKLSDLKKVGRPAILMSFLPACFEIAALLLLGPRFLGLSLMESAIVGAVLGAVSPAVVVPRMAQLMETRYGTEKRIPQLIMAGASCDDIFVIVLFTTFIGMEQGESATLRNFLDIPVSIVLGILLGGLVGWALAIFFERRYVHGNRIRNSLKVILILGFSFLLMAAEDAVKEWVAVSGLLAVVSMAMVLSMKCTPAVSRRLSEKFGKLWLAAEVILFVLVGAAVDIRYTMEAGLSAVLVILLALVLRSVGVLFCLIGTNLNKKERLYCVLSYLPKATVQAAIGSVPLALGLDCGNMVLSVAVLSILITAPLGAIAMDLSYKKLLTHDEAPAGKPERLPK